VRGLTSLITSRRRRRPAADSYMARPRRGRGRGAGRREQTACRCRGTVAPTHGGPMGSPGARRLRGSPGDAESPVGEIAIIDACVVAQQH